MNSTTEVCRLLSYTRLLRTPETDLYLIVNVIRKDVLTPSHSNLTSLLVTNNNSLSLVPSLRFSRVPLVNDDIALPFTTNDVIRN